MLRSENAVIFQMLTPYQRFLPLEGDFVFFLVTFTPFCEGGVCPRDLDDEWELRDLSEMRALSMRILDASSPNMRSSLLFLGFLASTIG